jgi:hypothetical protein
MLNEAARMATRCWRAFATPDVPTTSTISDTVAHYLEALDFLFIAISKRGSERDSSYR